MPLDTGALTLDSPLPRYGEEEGHVSAAELIQVITGAVFVLALVGLVRQAGRERTRATLDAVLLFAVLAVLAIQSPIVERLPEPAVFVAIFGTLLVTIPYLLLRVVADFAAVPVWLRWGGLGLCAALAIGFPLFSAEAIYLALLGLYFLAGHIYAGLAFTRQARISMGIVRRRLWAAALGSLIVGVVIVVSMATFLPEAALTAATLGLGLLSAVAYFCAFATPTWLRRAWREPDLRSFMVSVAAIPLSASEPDILLGLESAIRTATGAPDVSILVWDETGGVLRDRAQARLSPGEGLPGRSFAEQAGMIGDGIAVPITRLDGRIGVLVIRGRRARLFVSEELEMAQLLAVQAGIVLAGARPYAKLVTINAELNDATKAKSAFLSDMSHELRTPLNAILGFSELLNEQLTGTLTERQGRFLRNIRQAGAHLLDLINDVLDLAKVEAGKVELRREMLSLSDLVEPVIAAFTEAAATKHLAVVTAAPDTLVVFVDPLRLRQILLNLVSNAVKFTDAGTVRLDATTTGTDLEFAITDSGIGIPLEMHARVFGEFNRLHEGSSTEDGTGLGLAVSKRLVELMGGTIDFESREGTGTTFRVVLPHVVVVPVTGPRVLIVEDERHAAELMQAMAATLDLATEIVPTLASAHEAIARSAPIGVVLDMQLPDGRGESLLRELSGTHGHIPVVVVTGERDPDTAFLLGAEDYITKPIDWARLLGWLRQLKTSSEAGTAPAEHKEASVAHPSH